MAPTDSLSATSTTCGVYLLRKSQATGRSTAESEYPSMLIDEITAVSNPHRAVGEKFAEPSTLSYIAVARTYYLSIAMSKKILRWSGAEEK